MRRCLLPCLALAAAAMALPSTAAAVDTPSRSPLYEDGPDGRLLMDGQWLFRLDRSDSGVRRGYQRRSATGGWSAVRVPSAWNVDDESNASMRGTVGWYRKDFRLPDSRAALDWAVRFESVNHRSRVWLNGREVGHNTGAYLPFTIRLDGLRRGGTNRLVVRVDSRRRSSDFPPSSTNSLGVPSGGWWNYSGILREVYLERLDTIQFDTVSVLPRLGCRTCAATVPIKVALRNLTARTQRVSVTAGYGSQQVDLGTRAVPARGRGSFARTLRVASPQLWSPASPHLYPVTIEVRAGGRRVAGYGLHSGIRSVKVVRGQLHLNGEPMHARGVGLHEDNRAQGFAVDNAWRGTLVDDAKDLGATVLRTHYPLHPYLHELADREGLLIWSEVPVYQMKTPVVDRERVRRRATARVRLNAETNLNHPSVMLWSIANELSSRPDAGQSRYIRMASSAVRAIDPTRPVAIAVAGYPQVGCQRPYGPLDVIGYNDYFGWYPGPSGRIFDRTKLSGYLDSVRRCYPGKAIMITEFGAEANRDGPDEEKGTFAFQQDFVNFHLGVYATKPWLSGALYWAINEFKIRPGWDGGNPRPQPPIHQKGLVNYDGARKPAFFDVQRSYRATQQYGTAPH